MVVRFFIFLTSQMKFNTKVIKNIILLLNVKNTLTSTKKNKTIINVNISPNNSNVDNKAFLLEPKVTNTCQQ